MKQGNNRSWVEVDAKALRHNLGAFGRAIPETTRLMAVVKSNAYGHGMVECAKVFQSAGTDWFGVDDLDEALALRKGGIMRPILVLGYTLPLRYIEAVKKNISVTISSLEQLKNIPRVGLNGREKLRIHLKVDTGLHRQGIQSQFVAESFQLLEKIKKQVVIEGLYSHFAAAEDLESRFFQSYTNKQIEKFEKVVADFRKAGFQPLVHMSGTSASFVLSKAHFDIVRAGIGLYGLWPSSSTKDEADKVRLKPAMSWKTVVSEVKRVRKGERVGYDLSEKLSRDSVLAIMPVGYWHGLPRSASSKAEVLVRGKRAKIAGRVSMDMSIIDVTGIRGAKEGDEVTLIGKGMPAEELAEKCGTINYEIVTRINSILPRKFL